MRQSGANNSGELHTFLGVRYHTPCQTNDISADLFSVSQSFMLFGHVSECYKHIQYFVCKSNVRGRRISHKETAWRGFRQSNVEVGYESVLWSDHQSDSDHNSESEDDADPENTSDSAAGNKVSNLMGKDGTTEWSTVVPTKNKRTRSCNIIRTHLPCVRRESKNCKKKCV